MMYIHVFTLKIKHKHVNNSNSRYEVCYRLTSHRCQTFPYKDTIKTIDPQEENVSEYVYKCIHIQNVQAWTPVSNHRVDKHACKLKSIKSFASDVI